MQKVGCNNKFWPFEKDNEAHYLRWVDMDAKYGICYGSFNKDDTNIPDAFGFLRETLQEALRELTVQPRR